MIPCLPLPVQPVHSLTHSLAPPAAPLPGHDTLTHALIAAAKILIIDDEASNVRLLERILKRANCQNVISTTDSREALVSFEKHASDLVLTDWMMPHADGLAVLRHLRGSLGSDEYLPIVVLTADMTAETKRKALAAGATDFLTKPFDQMEVLLRIGNLLQARAAHLKIQEQNATLEDHVRERTIDPEKALTELKNTQRQVVQQERLAALGTMAGGIAHDFNNALSVIMGFSEILLRDAEEGHTKEKTIQALKTILTAAGDASKIVGRLREFYRQDDADDVHLPVNFNELLEQALFLTKPRWETQSRAAGIPIQIETHFDPIGLISGDAAALREVLTNLIFNAVDAMPGGGTITLRTLAREDAVVVEVSDTGSGMSDEVRERCLEPFFTTKGEKGTGLGLAMVFGIVQRHAGAVDLRSAPGEGTTFSLRFPTVEDFGETEVAAAIELHRPLHILVVEDQPILCQLLCDYLGSRHAFRGNRGKRTRGTGEIPAGGLRSYRHRSRHAGDERRAARRRHQTARAGNSRYPPHRLRGRFFLCPQRAGCDRPRPRKTALAHRAAGRHRRGHGQETRQRLSKRCSWSHSCATPPSSDLQQSHEFSARNEQLAAKHATSPQLSSLDQAVNAEVIDTQEVGCFLHGISETLPLSGRLKRRERRWTVHTGAPTI